MERITLPAKKIPEEYEPLVLNTIMEQILSGNHKWRIATCKIHEDLKLTVDDVGKLYVKKVKAFINKQQEDDKLALKSIINANLLDLYNRQLAEENYEGAAKILDRIIKLFGLNEIEQIVVHDSWAVTYGNDDDDEQEELDDED